MEVGNFKSLSERVARNLEITKVSAKHIVKVVLDCLIEEIKEKNVLQLNKYFSFKVMDRSGKSFGKSWSKKKLKVTVSDEVNNRFN